MVEKKDVSRHEERSRTKKGNQIKQCRSRSASTRQSVEGWNVPAEGSGLGRIPAATKACAKAIHFPKVIKTDDLLECLSEWEVKVQAGRRPSSILVGIPVGNLLLDVSLFRALRMEDSENLRNPVFPVGELDRAVLQGLSRMICLSSLLRVEVGNWFSRANTPR